MSVTSNLDNIKGKRFLITGGGGYVGERLAIRLLQAGAARVRLLDISFDRLGTRAHHDGALSAQQRRRLSPMIGSVSLAEDCAQACKGIDLVFHVASFGMSGGDVLKVEKVNAINVEGTKTIIAAAKEEGCEALVYTSTYNTIFGGRPIVNGEEDECEYFPVDEHCDAYSRSKSLAEQYVLSEARLPLRTCALRSAGIYGEGEERHFPRIRRIIEAGLFAVTIGGADVLVDYVYVDNLARAHLLAANALLGANAHRVDAEAFFVSDWEPVNNFEFIRPCCEYLNKSYPSVDLPVWFALWIAYLFESATRLATVFGVRLAPFLTQVEVYKTGVTHYFSGQKIKRVLGYEPLIDSGEGMRRLIEEWRRTDASRNENDLLGLQKYRNFLLFCTISVFLLFAFAYSRQLSM